MSVVYDALRAAASSRSRLSAAHCFFQIACKEQHKVTHAGAFQSVGCKSTRPMFTYRVQITKGNRVYDELPY